MMDALLAFGGSVVGGVMTGIITVATLKNDVAWIKDGLKDLQGRVHHIETKRKCNVDG